MNLKNLHCHCYFHLQLAFMAYMSFGCGTWLEFLCGISIANPESLSSFLVDRVQSFSRLNVENDLSLATLPTCTVINILKILFRTGKDWGLHCAKGASMVAPFVPPPNYGPTFTHVLSRTE